VRAGSARCSGVVVSAGSDGLYTLHQFKPTRRGRIDGIAFAVWQLCDGRRSPGWIAGELAAYFHIPPAISDVAESIERLERHGWVAAGTLPRQPLVRIRFAGPGKPSEPLDDYLCWVLTRCLDVVIVDDDTADLALVFGPGKTTQRLDTDEVQVLVCTDDSEPDLDTFDFAFGYGSVNTRNSGRYARMPPGARRSWPSHWADQDDHLSPGYRAQRLSRRLYDYLFDPSPWIDAHTPDRLKLTIGMATYDDFDGVYFSAQAIRLFHPEVTVDTEILVIDNNPGSGTGEHLRKLEGKIPGFRYVPWGWINTTSVRDMVFQEARGQWVLCMDSHVFLEPGSLRKLIEYIDANPASADLLQGPLIGDNLEVRGTHFEPRWRTGMFGIWAIDARGREENAEPFEIPMQGLGLFACRRDAWLWFNSRFRGFGGEEGYIHEKFRQAGRRTLCLPFLRWLHRFGRPGGAPYPNIWKDRMRNYLIGAAELGLDTGPIEQHFSDLLSGTVVEQVQRELRREDANPYGYFDAIFCINLDRQHERWKQVCDRFERIGIRKRVHRVPAAETPESHHTGCALTHRLIIDHAHRRGFERILVFEDDVLFLDGGNRHLSENLTELNDVPWNLLYLGGHRWSRRFVPARGCRRLRLLPRRGVTCTHAIAYHARVYDLLLETLPEHERDMETWVAKHHGVDQFLNTLDNRYLVDPVIASQPNILGQEDTALRDHYL
jgi:GR25 family glycosyltransferase involved in LPS biosynthesis